MERFEPGLGFLCRVLLGAALIHLTLAGDAQAYLDPGTVSFFFQAIVAALLGTLLVLKSRWRQLVAGIKGRFASDEPRKES